MLQGLNDLINNDMTEKEIYFELVQQEQKKLQLA